MKSVLFPSLVADFKLGTCAAVSVRKRPITAKVLCSQVIYMHRNLPHLKQKCDCQFDSTFNASKWVVISSCLEPFVFCMYKTLKNLLWCL